MEMAIEQRGTCNVLSSGKGSKDEKGEILSNCSSVFLLTVISVEKLKSSSRIRV